ncbi:MAG: hypothetical protein ACOCQD_03285 [archaeon]
MTDKKLQLIEHIIVIEKENENYITGNKNIPTPIKNSSSETITQLIMSNPKMLNYNINQTDKAILCEMVSNNEILLLDVTQPDHNYIMQKKFYFFVSDKTKSIITDFNREINREKRDRLHLYAYITTSIILLLQSTTSLFAYVGIFDSEPLIISFIFFGTLSIYVILFILLWMSLKKVK